MGEHLLCKQGVVGSNPIVSTSFGTGSGGRRLRPEYREKCRNSVLSALCGNRACGAVMRPSLRGAGLCQGESGSGASLGAIYRNV